MDFVVGQLAFVVESGVEIYFILVQYLDLDLSDKIFFLNLGWIFREIKDWPEFFLPANLEQIFFSYKQGGRVILLRKPL